MAVYEDITHAFVLKIWLEHTAEEGTASWRGHITHVTSRERRYVETLSEIEAFLRLYLRRMGIDRDGNGHHGD